MVKVPPGFESSPRLGRVLPKCHVGPGCRREEPAPGATPGALNWAPDVGRRGAAAGAAAGPARPAPGWLWLRAAGPGESLGQRPKRQGGGKARCPRRSPATCWQITWWRSSRWRMSLGMTTGTSSKVRARSPGVWGVGTRGWQVWKVLESSLGWRFGMLRPGSSRAHLATDPPIPTAESQRARPTALPTRHTG